MNILMLSGAKNSRNHAIEKHLNCIAASFVKLGNKVTLITSQPSQNEDELFLDRESYTLIYIPPTSFDKNPIKGNFSKDIQMLLTVRQVINVTNIVYVRFPIRLLSLIFLIIKRKKVIVEINGIGYEEQKNTLKGYTDAFEWWYLTLLHVLFSHKIIAVSQSIAETLKRDFKLFVRNKIYVVNNGINTNIFLAPQNEIPTIQRHNDKAVNYILFVGYIAHWQNLDITVDAASYLKKKGITDWKFLIVGDGKARQAIYTKMENVDVAEYFEWVGSVPQSTVPSYGAKASFAIAPFVINRKASPIKIFEYIAMGLYVVYAKIDGIEWVSEHGFGVSFEPENSENFSQTIYDTIISQSYMNMNKKTAYYFIANNYSWDKSAKKILATVNI